MPDLTLCPRATASWIFIAIGAALVLAIAALGLALVGSAHARKAAYVSMFAVLGVVAVAVWGPLGPIASDVSPRRARLECVYLGGEWALAPLLVALGALGVAIARARAKDDAREEEA